MPKHFSVSPAKSLHWHVFVDFNQCYRRGPSAGKTVQPGHSLI
jgi:hypothetical protein